MQHVMALVDQRSQPILRLPRDQTPAVLTMHDGELANVMLFVPPGDSITHMLEETSPFMPVSFSTGTRLLARSAIACIAVREVRWAASEDDLPIERQQAIVRLRGGIEIKGELRWTPPPGRRRTLDHLNEAATHLAIYDGDVTSYVAKAHIAGVEEI